MKDELQVQDIETKDDTKTDAKKTGKVSSKHLVETLGDVENGDVILNLLNDTDLVKVDVKVEDTSAITGKRKIYLMKLANGKTLAFTAGDGTTTYADDVSQNAKKTATLTKTRKVEQEDNNLLLVDNIAFDFRRSCRYT